MFTNFLTKFDAIGWWVYDPYLYHKLGSNFTLISSTIKSISTPVWPGTVVNWLSVHLTLSSRV